MSLGHNHHLDTTKPVNWVISYLNRIPKRGRVLDLACGSGRHTRLLLGKGYSVTAVDRDISQICNLCETDNLEILEYDLEGPEGWPFSSGYFDGIIVVNYLHRPLFPSIIDSLAENGVLIYQTFASGNENYGSPRNPDFLLVKDELLDFFGLRLEVVAFRQGYTRRPSPAVVQCICCVNTPTR